MRDAREDVKLYLETSQDNGFHNIKHDYCERIENAYERIETRRYWTTSEINWLKNGENWK